MKSLYLIKREPRPEWVRAPYHPVIICARRHIAKWEAGWSGDHAWVWTRDWDAVSGWLLSRWNGLDIDYGHVVRGLTLPDGRDAAFCHDRDGEPWTLLTSAVWWDVSNMPDFVKNWGVKYPADEFTRRKITRSSGDLYGVAEGKWHDRVEMILEKPDCWLNATESVTSGE